MKKAQYKPSEDEHFMSARQLAYFKEKIISRKEILLRVLADGHADDNVGDHNAVGDPADHASDAILSASNASHRQHDEETLCALEKALARIENGTYGYCEVTGEPINLARLDAFPAATMSIEAQENFERQARITRLPELAEE